MEEHKNAEARGVWRWHLFVFQLFHKHNLTGNLWIQRHSSLSPIMKQTLWSSLSELESGGSHVEWWKEENVWIERDVISEDVSQVCGQSDSYRSLRHETHGVSMCSLVCVSVSKYDPVHALCMSVTVRRLCIQILYHYSVHCMCVTAGWAAQSRVLLKLKCWQCLFIEPCDMIYVWDTESKCPACDQQTKQQTKPEDQQNWLYSVFQLLSHTSLCSLLPSCLLVPFSYSLFTLFLTFITRFFFQTHSRRLWYLYLASSHTSGTTCSCSCCFNTCTCVLQCL